VEHFIEGPLAAVIPEDSSIPKSVAAKTPVVLARSNCAAARAFKKFCMRIQPGIRSFRPAQAGKDGFFSSILNRFGKAFGL
jgi:septum formation inhibitor-activating ATPase MinD